MLIPGATTVLPGRTSPPSTSPNDRFVAVRQTALTTLSNTTLPAQDRADSVAFWLNKDYATPQLANMALETAVDYPAEGGEKVVDAILRSRKATPDHVGHAMRQFQKLAETGQAWAKPYYEASLATLKRFCEPASATS